LMFSRKCHKSRVIEKESYKRKISVGFCRHIKRSKSAFAPYNLLDALQASLACIRYARDPPGTDTCPPLHHFYSIMREMVRLVMALDLPRPYQQKLNNDKIANIMVALFYIAVDGIVVGDHVFLSSCAALKHALPVQLLLWPVFKIQPKLITEGENIVKMCIKNMSPGDVARHGTPPTAIRTEAACQFVNHVSQCTCPSHDDAW